MKEHKSFGEWRECASAAAFGTISSNSLKLIQCLRKTSSIEKHRFLLTRAFVPVWVEHGDVGALFFVSLSGSAGGGTEEIATWLILPVAYACLKD